MRPRRDPSAQRIDARFWHRINVVRRHRQSYDHRGAKPIEFSRSDVRSSCRPLVGRTNEHLVEQVAVPGVARLDLRHGPTKSTRLRIGFVRVPTRLSFVRNAADDRTDAIGRAEVETHGTAAVFDWAMTTCTSRGQTLRNGTLGLARIIHAARGDAGTCSTKQFFGYRASSGVIQGGIHRRSWGCLSRRELQNDARLERCSIEGVKTKRGLLGRSQDREPILRVGNERGHCWQPIGHGASYGIVTWLEENPLSALINRRNWIRTRLKTHRLTNGVFWVQETIKPQTDTRRGLDELRRIRCGIRRAQRDRRGISHGIDTDEGGVDKVQGRGVEGLILGRTDVTSREKNSDEGGKKKDELGVWGQERRRRPEAPTV